MNNDLEQFSEEGLKELIEHINQMPDANGKAQFAALARIALAAKQAKPVGYATRDENYDWHIDFCGEAHCLSQGDSLYATPQPAHTEQDDWIKCSERMPDETDTVVVVDGGLDVYPSTFYKGNFYEYGDTLPPCLINNPTHWMPLPATPKPESE